MACGDTTIGDALNNIAIALNSMAQATAIATAQGGGCCDNRGSRGGGISSPPVSTATQGDPETDPPPDGFEDWSQFQTSKCGRSADFIQRLEKSLNDLKELTFVGVEVGGIYVAAQLLLSVTIPFTAIATIVALLAGVVAELVLSNCAEVIGDNEQDLLCQLYAGHSSAEAQSNFLTLVNQKIDDGGYDTVVAFAMKQVIANMTSNDEMNALFEHDAVRTYPEADCSNCGEVPFKQQLIYGSAWEDWDEVQVGINDVHEFDSAAFGTAPSNQWEYIIIDFGGLVDVDFAYTGHVVPASFGASAFRAGSSFGGDYGGESNVYNSNTPPDSLEGVGNIAFVGEYLTPWSLEITRRA